MSTATDRSRLLVRIRNIHERIIGADPEDIAPLLATLGQPDDALYPPLRCRSR